MSTCYSIGSDGRHTSSVIVGNLPNLHGWVRSDVYFHRFADSKPAYNQHVTSPSFSCFGRDWTIKVEGPTHRNDRYTITLGQQKCKNIVAQISIPSIRFCEERLYVDRDDILDRLAEGDLWIEVRMRMKNVAFIPVSSACRTLHNLSINKDSADVVFEVKGDKDTSPKSKFYAHRLILRTAAPQLAELCLTQSLVEIPNISSATFEVLLFYIYGGKRTNFGEDIAEVKNIIDAADKYAVINLKLDAEVWYIMTTEFTVDNVIQHLQYAESKNCALLKEAAVDFIVKSSLINSKLLVDVAVEVSAAVARRGGDNGELWSMSICDLRRKASHEGLDVDGSRVMLISSLEPEADD